MPAVLLSLIMPAMLALAGESGTSSGSVRLWPTGVVTGDIIAIDDVCELIGFDPQIEHALSRVHVADAPPPGGSRLIHIDLIRSAIAAAGVNMATVTLRGSIECAVSKPVVPVSSAPAPANTNITARRQTLGESEVRLVSADQGTLRRAVVDFFGSMAHRYGGRAEVVFGRTDEAVLDLSDSMYTFVVKRRNNRELGLIPLEIEIRAGGEIVQTVPLIVKVTLLRQVVVARRAIRKGAVIGAGDVHKVPMSFARAGKLGLGDVAQVIGQRAKRAVQTGAMIESGALEPVPLVSRGQLVTLESVAGRVAIVTTAKAMGTGMLHDVISVRVPDRRKVELEAVIVGPGRVRVGATAFGTLKLAQAGGL